MNDGPARYFFNILTPSGVVEDIEGSELPSLEEARAEAIKDIRFLMSAAIRQGRDISGRSIEINEAGDVVTVVGFQEAISESDLPM
jgi:hypothetical protein